MTSNLDISDFLVTISNFPKGTIITDINGNKKEKFNAGDIFQINIPKSEFEKQNVEVKIKTTFQIKDYVLFYAASYNEETQDYVLTGNPISSLNSCYKTLSVKNNNAKIKIYKVDEYNSPISGVTFELLNLNGEVLQTSVTNSEGIVIFNNLYQGTYYVKEKNSAEGYLLNGEILEIAVDCNSTEERTIKNGEPTGTLIIIKQDKENGSIPQGDATLEGAIYKVFADEDIYNVSKTKKFYNKGDVVATRITNEKGETDEVTDLPLGKYMVKEVKAPMGYLLDKTEYRVNLEYKNPSTEIITKKIVSIDEVKKMQVHIYKSGMKENSGIVPGLQGVEFSIKLYSNVEKALHAGYTYVEIWNGMDESGNKVKVDSKRVAEAQAIAPTIETIVTDVNGDAYTQNDLVYGKYIVKETKTPTDYETSVDFMFSVSEDESEVEEIAKKIKHIVVNNEQLETYIKLIKKDQKTGKCVTLNSTTFEIKAIEDIYDRATNKILFKKGETISQKVGNSTYTSFTTNADNIVVPDNSYNSENDNKAEVTTPLKLPVGKYEIIEIKIPEGFLQSDKPVTFEIKNIKDYDTDKDGDFIKEIVIKNEQPTGTIKLDKTVAIREKIDTSLVDISDLSGIEFKLIAKEDIIDMADGSVIYKQGQEIKGYNLTKDGKLTIKDLPIGTYEIEETKTLDGLIVNDTKYEVKFKQKDTVTEVYEQKLDIANNTTITEISKTDITGEKELEGAKLSIIDEEGNIIDEWISTDKVHTVEGLKVDEEYILREDLAPLGYVKSTDVKFILENTLNVQKVKMVDKVLKITKKDLINGKELEGAKLQVIDEEGNVIDEWISEKTPHAVKGLEEGKKYKLIEIISPYGYEIAKSIEFKVSMEKETQMIEMKDMPILRNIKVVKKDSNTGEIIKDNFKFGIYEDKECTNLIKEVESNIECGIVEFNNLRYGTYYIKEIQAPINYELSSKIVKIDINENGIYADNEELLEKDGAYSLNYYNTLIPVIQTGINTNYFLIIFLMIISIIGIMIGFKMIKRKSN